MAIENFNRELATHDFVQQMKWNVELRQRFEQDPGAVLDQFELLPQERTAIEERDFKALYDIGVHPYLLSQLARLLYGTVEGAGSSEASLALVRSLLGEDAPS
ncbi:MAG: extradiol ring-cleavage dioxygenase [Solirubrobacterales bacterium]|nr:extradiol ring-cleavage dioxygenase [Solirubrobacterales bacterium]